MPKSAIIAVTLLLAGCGVNTSYEMQQGTTPGQPLPSGIAVCSERDQFGRCKVWSSQSDICTNPDGFGNPLPCTQLKGISKKKYEF